jgi:nitroreductase
MVSTVDTWEAIRTRRNARDFSGQTIPAEHLDRILEAGRRAPSARNRQPWDFVVVTDRDQLAELATVWQGAGHVARSAATIAIIAPTQVEEIYTHSLYYDLGQATMSMMLEAVDAGVVSGHSSVRDQDKAQQVLGFPDGKFCAYLISLGYPVNGPLKPLQKPNRRPFDEVVHRSRW